MTETPRVGQPLAELESRPGLTREVAIGVLPMRAPAGVKEHRVTGLDVDIGHVVEPDDIARPAATDVDKPAARDDLGHRLDAQPRHPRGRGVGQREAVVAGVTHPQVAEGVEVRAELHRRADDLVAPVHAVVPERRPRVGHERLAEVAPGEDRDALVQLPAEVEEPALAHERHRPRPLGVVDVAQGAELRSGGHSDDHGSRKLGYRVRPPSTKIVCPVIYAASSLARKHATPPISSAVPARRIGM